MYVVVGPGVLGSKGGDVADLEDDAKDGGYCTLYHIFNESQAVLRQ
jgi:hypothetical protein